MLAEVLGTYRNLMSGGPARNPAVPGTNYAAYVALEREALRSKQARQHWLNILRGAVRTELPWRSARLDSPGQAPKVGREQLILSEEHTSELFSVAHREGVPIKTILQSAFLRMLAELGGCSDVLAGTLENGRPETAGSDELAGLFLNVLPLRARMDCASWRELFDALISAEAAGHPYRRYPSTALQRDFGGRFATALFNFTNFHPYAALAEGASPRLLEWTASDQTFYPLTLQCALHWDRRTLRVAADYQTNVFNAADAAEALVFFEAAVAAAVEAPDESPMNRSLAPTRPAGAQGRAVRGTGRAGPQDRFLDLFRKEVSRGPERIACLDSERSITYSKLETESSGLARCLLANGARPGGVVGIYADRSIDFLIGILAVLKVRAAFLPVHPEWPLARVAAALADASATILLVDEHRPERHRELARGLGESFVPVSLRTRGESSDELPQPATGHELAYIFFTSGSTGRPKGAMVGYDGMVNHLLAKIDELEMTEQSIVAQCSSQCFDVSVWQFLSPLLCGGRSVVFTDEEITDPVLMLWKADSAGITILETVPSVLKPIVAELHSGRLDPAPRLHELRWLVVMGEALPPGVAVAWNERYPGTLVNAYGATETSDDVTHHRLSAGHDADAPVPVGRPIRNSTIRVLDRSLRPLATGVTGDVYVS
ncbi:MAG: AMP-binding protein, partial [Chloroflexota bacterium]